MIYEATENRSQTETQRSWISLAWLSLLLVATYAPILWSMGGSWFDENADMGHGFLVPIIAGYMISCDWNSFTRLKDNGSRWGFVLLLWAAVQSVIASLGAWTFLSRTAFLLSLFGILITLKGFAAIRTLAYPLGLLFLMVPPPTFVYERITFPLQILASILAANFLELLGFSVLREGNILEMVGQRLSVVEACSGIRSLITLSFFALVYNYFFVRRLRMRIALLLLLVPVVILGNSFRIVLTGVVGHYNHDLAHGLFHSMSGYVIAILSGAMYIAMHQLFERVSRSK
jgi:eight transmembrane protein EpsH (proposed exosortase)